MTKIMDRFFPTIYFCIVGIYRHMPMVYYDRRLKWTNVDGIKYTVGGSFKTKINLVSFLPKSPSFSQNAVAQPFIQFFLTFLPPTHAGHPFPSPSRVFLIFLPPTHIAHPFPSQPSPFFLIVNSLMNGRRILIFLATGTDDCCIHATPSFSGRPPHPLHMPSPLIFRFSFHPK
uniref:Uncharacterized protein n=1 Tax=Cucumis melo TaxID=3656 RepID=A0A9I9DPI9_CUCME